MKNLKVFLAVFFFAVVFSSYVFAHPPSVINLAYDKTSQILRIAVEHTSSRLTKHYIRELVVYQNDKKVNDFTYPRQTTATALLQDVPIKASGNDIIRVKVSSTEGGTGEAVIVISSDKDSKDLKSKKPDAMSTTVDKNKNAPANSPYSYK